MRFDELYGELDRRFPRTLSADWDNDGVMCRVGDEADSVLIALDATLDVIRYASENGFSTVLTHHPMIFRPITSLDGETAVSRRVLFAATRGINVISLHTRLDAGDGGVNDTLARVVGLRVFGTFGPSDAPTLGRLAEFDGDCGDLALCAKTALGCAAVRVTGSGSARRVAICGGDGGSMIEPARAAGADVLITGDVGYNAAEAAAEMGLSVIEAGHYNTEFPVCLALSEILETLGVRSEIYEACPSTII